METIHRAEIDLMKVDTIRLSAFGICRIETKPGNDGVVEIWFITGKSAPTRRYRVIPTGGLIRSDEEWRASTSRSSGGLVWHLIEVLP